MFTLFSGPAGSRRSHATDGALAGAHWLFGRNRLDIESHQLIRDGYRTQLDERAFAVLTCLLRHAEQVVPRSTLVAEAWPGVAHVNDSAVSKTMRRLRIALGSEAGRSLSTVYGVGYRLTTPAVLVPAGATLPQGGAGTNGTAVSVPGAPRPRLPGPGVPEPARAQDIPAQPEIATAAGVRPEAASVRERTDRARRHRMVVIAVLLLTALLAAWLLLAPVAR
ncbi:winged helix-turn-helix domain-containing protein [Luteimonas sp. MC1572]|uniref:winged helix-turn-helix domain-containing protein n=1 Tax=Luteimonas sp. MC1572 TaxID=2799325 RepID=UPI0018F09232|nr:winged helix-turn-helix domain-containing protein [Luteimonas sp. MC1572]MBJ6980391.1 winged helix-turn-helix transcriptional regulator [Luteimonas sp. MC1572]QQO04274.1 winged helix-turn-helix transcriptional regulator [Luteimonas sp. MC1572]